MTHINFYKAEVLGQALRRRGWRVSCAESCTGGGIAEAITAVAGSSEWFDLGLVTYSNQMKSKLLGVPEGELLEHGAVSQVVVESMLRGALTLSGANIAVAVSGVAGPGGGSPEKPVGTVFVAWGALGDIRSERLQLEGDRASIRSQTVEFGLNKLNEFCDTEEKNTV